jgi:hypothetical protein
VALSDALRFGNGALDSNYQQWVHQESNAAEEMKMMDDANDDDDDCGDNYYYSCH